MTGRRGHNEGGIRRRTDGRWEATIDLGWVNGKRRRKYLYGKTRAEVARKLREAMAAHDNGQVLDNDRRTVGAYLAWWQTVVLPGTVAEGSLETYQRHLRLYVEPILGHHQLKKLTPGHVTQMMREMAERELSPATQNAARKVLGRALRRAQQEGFVLRNAAQLADAPRVVHAEGRAMTSEEVRRFIRALHGQRLEAAYLAAVVLGLRRGELLGLRWEDVDLAADEPTVEVTQQLQRRKGEGLVFTGLKTTKSRRSLVVPPELARALNSWRVVQAQERLAAGPLWADRDGVVFTTPAGTPVDPDNFRHRLARITQAAGLGEWRTHELRKSMGSLLFDQGVPMKLISEALGHSSERVTSDVYVKTRPTARGQVASAIAQAIWTADERA